MGGGDLGQLVGDGLPQQRLVLEQCGELADGTAKLLGLLVQLEPVVLGQPPQRGVQDVAGLDLGEVEDLHQAVARRGGVVGGPDHGDDLVDVQQRDQQAIHQVQPVFCLLPAELTAPADHVEPVLDEDLEKFLQAERAWLPVDQGHVVDGERVLQRGQAVELFQHGLRHEPALELDDQP